nr:hypothetical protein GCM10020093_034150 [Planobispora longispora]
MPLEETVAASSAEVAGLLAAELGRGFDLERGPVWRALLVRVPGGDDLLIVTVHHIACDARSLDVLARSFADGPGPARNWDTRTSPHGSGARSPGSTGTGCWTSGRGGSTG